MRPAETTTPVRVMGWWAGIGWIVWGRGVAVEEGEVGRGGGGGRAWRAASVLVWRVGGVREEACA